MNCNHTHEASDSLPVLSREHVNHLCHDLRGPLANIRAFAELLSDGLSGPLSAKQREDVNVITRHSLRLAQLLDDLQVITETATEPDGESFRTFDLVALCHQAIEDMAPAFHTREVASRLDSSGELQVEGMDEKRVAAILRWLLSRRLASADKGETIVLRLECLGSRVHATISRSWEPHPPGQHGPQAAARRPVQDSPQNKRLALDVALARGALAVLGGSASGEMVPDGSVRFDIELPVYSTADCTPCAPNSLE